MQEKLKALVRSRRFWVAVSGVVILVANDVLSLSLTPDTVQAGVLLLGSWIIGDSLSKTV
mgnify:CR=1 FL=1